MEGVERCDGNGEANKRFLVTICRPNFGKIQFLSPVKLEDLVNWKNIVSINHKVVVVYPREDSRPPVGTGLNCSAEVTLERIWRMEKGTLKGKRKKSLEGRLQEICRQQGAEFVSYHDEGGILKFKVPHFSKYSVDVDDEEDEKVDGNQNVIAKAKSTLAQSTQQEGKLGGIGLKELEKRQCDQLKHYPNQPTYQHKSMLSPSLLSSLCGAGDAPFRDINNEMFLNLESITEDVIKVGEGIMDEPICTSTPREQPTDIGQNVPLFNMNGISGSDVEASSGGKAKPFLFKYSPILKSSGSSKSQILQSLYVAERNQPSTDVCGSPDMIKHPKIRGVLMHNETQGPVKRINSINTTDVTQAKGSIPNETSLQFPPVIASRKEVDFLSVGRSESEDLFSNLQPKNSTVISKMFGAPRVCFSRNGIVVTIKNSVTTSGRFQGLSEISKIGTYFEKQEPFPLASTYREVLTKQLTIVQKHRGRVQFLEYADILTDQMSKTKVPKTRNYLKSEQIIWQLCNILWPEEVSGNQPWNLLDDGFGLEQRARLSNWLIKNASMLFGTQYKNQDDSVFGWLKKGRVDEASEKAISEGNDWLAVILNAGETSYYLAGKEFGQYFQEKTMDILNICLGLPLHLEEISAELILNMWSCDWLQYFAMYLWYHKDSPSHHTLVSIGQTIRNFEHSLRKICGDEEYPLPKNESSSVADLCVKLLRLYSCHIYPVNNLLSPYVRTIDILDYKLSWLLMINLEVLGYIPTNDAYSHIWTSFAGQLEQIGMFEWAIFVAKHQLSIDPDNAISLQKNVINLQILKLLEKHVLNAHDNLTTEKFITDELGIDENIIYGIKAKKAYTFNRQDKEICYYLHAGEYQKAFNVFKKYIDMYGIDMVSMINKREHRNEYLNSMLGHLEMLFPFRKGITGWEIHGNLMLNYLRLSKKENILLPVFPCVSNEGDKATDADNISSCVETTVLEFIRAIFIYNPTTSRQCSFLLDLTLTAQKAIEVAFAHPNVDKHTKDTIKNELFHFLDIPVPQEYFTGLREFINNVLFIDNDIKDSNF